jgi:sulfur-carrier protein adenylyltransferase/sulfurtransferase
MSIRDIFSSFTNLNADQFQSFIDANPEGSFTLLDVRQLPEYEAGRIPGSQLIPLPALNERLQELDPEKPVIAYWAAGRRSRAAAQILTGKGFKQVYNLKGGIAAWQGQAAAGPVEFGMLLLKGDETPQDIIYLAYGLEEGLRKFYAAASQLDLEKEVEDVLARLAEIEVRHKQKLFDLYKKVDSADTAIEEFEKKVNVELMEGGFNVDKVLDEISETFKTAAEVLNFAMMLEAQGMDLYLRYAEKSENPQVREILFAMGDDEKAHLKSLGNLMEKI